jgi:hypothetical protein
MSAHHIDLQDLETSELIVLFHMHFKSGLAKFSPQEDHIIRKDSPDGALVYTYIERGELN